MTTVVNIRHHQKYDVYIGRRGFSPSIHGSKWHNPFHIGKDGTRDEVITKYEQYVRSSPELMAALPELKDKVLGCWCKPKPCHGDVLVKLFEELKAKQ